MKAGDGWTYRPYWAYPDDEPDAAGEVAVGDEKPKREGSPRGVERANAIRRAARKILCTFAFVAFWIAVSLAGNALAKKCAEAGIVDAVMDAMWAAFCG